MGITKIEIIETMNKIEKLENVIEYSTYTQPKGIYYDAHGNPFEQEEDVEVETGSSRPPNNEEIMNKINEIIEYINEQ